MNINPFAIQAPDSVESVLDNANATCVRFNHGRGLFAGHYIAAGRSDGIVAIWSVETRGLLRFLEGHVKCVTSVTWSPCARFLATSSLDWNVIVWDLAQRNGGERMHTLRFDAAVASVQFSPTSSRRLVVVLQSQQAVLIDLRRKRQRFNGGGPSNGQGFRQLDNLPHDISEVRKELHQTSRDDAEDEVVASAGVISAAFAADGQRLVLGTSKGDIIAFDASSAAHLARTSAGSSGVRELAFDRSGKTLVANLNDRSIRLFTFAEQRSDQEGGRVNIKITPQHRFQDLVNRTPWSGIGFSGDSEYVFGGAIHKAAHNIYIWDRGAGVLDKILQGPRDSLITCDWHPNRPMIASVSHTGAINIWFTPPTEIWSAYAPGFEELEENVIYEEREDEFDLEDEEEATRRKQDEEGAHVDIVSQGLHHSSRIHAGASRSSAHAAKSHAERSLANGHIDDEDGAASNSDVHFAQGALDADMQDSIDDDDMDAYEEFSDEEESFAIPVRLSLDLPDLDAD